MQESVSIDWRLSKFIAVITCQDMFPAIYPTALSPRCMYFLTSMSISKSSSNTNKAFTHSNLQCQLSLTEPHPLHRQPTHPSPNPTSPV